MLIQRKGLLQRLPVLAVAVVLTLGLVPARSAQAQDQTFYACYVPDVGAIYLAPWPPLTRLHPAYACSSSHTSTVW